MKYTPVEKRSKAEQKAWYSSQRRDWNGIKPTTRVIPDKRRKLLDKALRVAV